MHREKMTNQVGLDHLVKFFQII